ncbi:TRAP transporter large permease [Pannonibacter indicus]|uniref:TRAP transporter large permease protein n=1 Tax=Pannonibacter indicus TaxID=466044 RepID=A0A0K6HXU1_9HYPH|nr:TRAP transporter large permease [Pannonibacter indicus]CUA95867.1 TRAP transporter, DctM subunit [Pannonibacter indicus]
MTLAFVICLGVLLALAALGAPIALSMIVSSIVYVAMRGQDMALPAEQLIQGIYDSYVILAVPLFIVAANIMNAGTVSERLLGFVVAIVGRFRGGLGHVNVVASLIFAGMSGSAVADAAGIGKLIINMMREGGRYTAGYAAAITAASSTIGPIIPPSIPMVLYALVSDQSIGYLFLGGIVPGLIMGAVLMLMNARISARRGFKLEEPVPVRQIPRLTVNAFPALMMPVILLAGIYGGMTTPTEAAALAALYALFLSVVFYRALSFRAFWDIMRVSASQSASVGVVIGGALIFNYIVASENIPAHMQAFAGSLDISPLMFLLMINVLLLLLGCLLDASTLILVIIPLFLPACRELGIDLVHFGVVAIVNCMIGLITPPYGIVLFVINAVTGISLREMIREIWPFLGALLAALLALILFPDLVLWLPRMFGYAG